MKVRGQKRTAGTVKRAISIDQVILLFHDNTFSPYILVSQSVCDRVKPVSRTKPHGGAPLTTGPLLDLRIFLFCGYSEALSDERLPDQTMTESDDKTPHMT